MQFYYRQAVLVGPVIFSVLVGSAIFGLAGRIRARIRAGAEELAMVTVYRNTLRHVMEGSPSAKDAFGGASRLLPWIQTPGELEVWKVALGLDNGPNHAVGKAC